MTSTNAACPPLPVAPADTITVVVAGLPGLRLGSLADIAVCESAYGVRAARRRWPEIAERRRLGGVR
jgi:hypothetical protein